MATGVSRSTPPVPGVPSGSKPPRPTYASRSANSSAVIQFQSPYCSLGAYVSGRIRNGSVTR